MPRRKRIATAFGIERNRVLSDQWVDHGPGWAVLRPPTAEDVLTLEPDLSLIPNAMVGAGVAEDPVCGSVNASVGQWLVATGAAPSHYRASQGRRPGRSGTIGITADADGPVRVTGTATSCVRGTLTL
ncbi:PhzF family phenazine biosynthesis protein [Streptomyces sp. NPDC051985]|uniref:PhzF family phenazine biosynthesis protein n=1 Tax=Streptomyces sp. NPDC051985 TaxID=3155807 RepID=UPI003423F1F6